MAVSSRLISVLSVVVSRPDSALNLSLPFSALDICSSASLMIWAASCLIEAAELSGRVLLALVISSMRVLLSVANWVRLLTLLFTQVLRDSRDLFA